MLDTTKHVHGDVFPYLYRNQILPCKYFARCTYPESRQHCSGQPHIQDQPF
uniref:Uncharacterized protein n=1 Tax=Arundo donax TaxID=35708 RepID=A0A0A9FKI9_ARUDO